MRFVHNSSSITEPFPGVVLTIGNFDGVHRGHQLILSELVERAKAGQGTSVLMTFDPPPATVLGRAPLPQIMTLSAKREVVASLGVDVFVCETFHLALASMSPQAFMQELLLARLRPSQILVGYDFCFGRRREGNFEVLRDFFGPKGCRVEQFQALRDSLPGSPSTEVVSSTRIRKLLIDGEVREATRLLGRPHFIEGIVLHGDARGRLIGFPTANVQLDGRLLPKNGVYVVEARAGDTSHLAVANLGRRPTFGGEGILLEVHLVDFEGDLYGRSLRVAFLERIRGEQRFPGVEALKQQIEADVLFARRFWEGER